MVDDAVIVGLLKPLKLVLGKLVQVYLRFCWLLWLLKGVGRKWVEWWLCCCRGSRIALQRGKCVYVSVNYLYPISFQISGLTVSLVCHSSGPAIRGLLMGHHSGWRFRVGVFGLVYCRSLAAPTDPVQSDVFSQTDYNLLGHGLLRSSVLVEATPMLWTQS
jgi:hypothetical protein